jgi:arginine/lysine/ornithine decarboxylase
MAEYHYIASTSPDERIAAALERIAAVLERQETRRESAAALEQQTLLAVYARLRAEMDAAYQRLDIAERMAERAEGPRSAAAASRYVRLEAEATEAERAVHQFEAAHPGIAAAWRDGAAQED